MSRPLICIATPAYGGQVSTQYAGGLCEATVKLNEWDLRHQVLMLGNESQVHRARNKCVSYAKLRPFTHLLFIDADLGFRPEHIKKLLDADRQVIGGTYPIKKLPISLNFNPVMEHEYYFSAIKTAEEFKKYAAREGAVVPVRHVPTGFLMINMNVFERLDSHFNTPTTTIINQTTGTPSPYWEYFRPGIHAGVDESEDWMFSRVCREAGIGVDLHTEVVLPHVGTFEYKLD